MQKNLEKAIADLLKQVHEKRWKYQIYQIIVTANGNLIYGRHFYGKQGFIEYQSIVEHNPTDKHEFPLTLILVDSKGQVITASLPNDKSEYHIYPSTP